ncbi:hypothetical protein MAP00_000726 [Monascus purpureus]|nr:hypothetical protein MAP00_000726 [Monascus purpureus]
MPEYQAPADDDDDDVWDLTWERQLKNFVSRIILLAKDVRSLDDDQTPDNIEIIPNTPDIIPDTPLEWAVEHKRQSRQPIPG